jgi:rhodanese-related sulfurtransferase
MAESIDVSKLKELIESENRPLLLDVRRKSDHDVSSAQIQGAVWRDPEKTDEWSVKLPAEADIVVYCVRGGSVSQSTADRLVEKGFRVHYISGGIMEWIGASFPLEKE